VRPEEVRETAQPVKLESVNGGVGVSARTLRLHRTRSSSRLLSSVNPGQRIAIVGPTGARQDHHGQVADAVLRRHDGAIWLMGHDIRSSPVSTCASCLAWSCKIPGSTTAPLMENIRSVALRSTRGDRPAKAPRDHFVRHPPEQYPWCSTRRRPTSLRADAASDHRRAFLADPRILILDEATSSVDTRTEVLIQKAMDSLDEEPYLFRHSPSPVHDP